MIPIRTGVVLFVLVTSWLLAACVDNPVQTQAGPDAAPDTFAGDVGGSRPDADTDVGSDSPDMAHRPSRPPTVAASLGIGCTIANDNRVWCWGRKAPGSAHDSPFAPVGFSLGPRPVGDGAKAADGLFTAMWSTHVCGLSETGEISCWGDRTELSSVGPFDYTAPAFTRRDFDDLAFSGETLCGLEDGTLWCWGTLPHVLESDIPVDVGEGKTFDDVVASFGALCGISDETLLCMGEGRFSADHSGGDTTHLTEVMFPAVPVELGFMTRQLVVLDEEGRSWEIDLEEDTEPAITELPELPPFVRIGTGHYLACGITAEGEVWCWPRDKNHRWEPWHVDLPHPAVSVSVAPTYTCAATEDGQTYCWGKPVEGQLGRPMAYLSPTPAFEDYEFEDITLGTDRICGLTTDGSVFCGGYMGSDGIYGDWFEPELEKVDVEPMTEISGGDRHECGTTREEDDGSIDLYCWGFSTHGALGGVAEDSEGHVPLSGSVVASAAAAGSTCAYASDGSLTCWGRHYTDEGASIALPADVTPSQLAISSSTFCALDSGNAYCWAAGETDASLLTDAPTFSTLEGGGPLMCGLDEAGIMYCWAPGQVDMAGISGRDPGEDGIELPTPTRVEGAPAFKQISVALNHACGVTLSNDRVLCWGRNTYGERAGGQLGDDTLEPHVQPAPVLGDMAFEQVVAGPGRTCALDSEGKTHCWGVNHDGLLGPIRGPWVIRTSR